LTATINNGRTIIHVRDPRFQQQGIRTVTVACNSGSSKIGCKLSVDHQCFSLFLSMSLQTMRHGFRDYKVMWPYRNLSCVYKTWPFEPPQVNSVFSPASIHALENTCPSKSYLNLACAEDLCRLANKERTVRLQYLPIHLEYPVTRSLGHWQRL